MPGPTRSESPVEHPPPLQVTARRVPERSQVTQGPAVDMASRSGTKTYRGGIRAPIGVNSELGIRNSELHLIIAPPQHRNVAPSQLNAKAQRRKGAEVRRHKTHRVFVSFEFSVLSFELPSHRGNSDFSERRRRVVLRPATTDLSRSSGFLPGMACNQGSVGRP